MSTNPLRRSPRTKDTYMSYLRKALLSFTTKEFARPWDVEEFIRVVRGKARIRVTGLQSSRVDSCLRTSIDQLLEQGLILHDNSHTIRFLSDSAAFNDFLYGSKAVANETKEGGRASRSSNTGGPGYKRPTRSSPRKKVEKSWYEPSANTIPDENSMVVDSRRNSFNSDVDMGAPAQEARPTGLGTILEEPVKFEDYRMVDPGPSRPRLVFPTLNPLPSPPLSATNSWVLVESAPSDPPLPRFSTPGAEGTPMVVSPDVSRTAFQVDPRMMVDSPKRPEFDHVAIEGRMQSAPFGQGHDLRVALRRKEAELDQAEQSLRTIQVACDKLDRVYQHLEGQYCKLRYPHPARSSSSIIPNAPTPQYTHLTTSQLVTELLGRAWNKVNDAKLGRDSKDTERRAVVDAISALRHELGDLRAQMDRCQLEDAAAQGLLRLGLVETGGPSNALVPRDAMSSLVRLPDRLQDLDCVRAGGEGHWKENTRKWVEGTLERGDGAAVVSREMVQVVQVAMQAQLERESLQAAADAAAEMYLQLDGI